VAKKAMMRILEPVAMKLQENLRFVELGSPIANQFYADAQPQNSEDPQAHTDNTIVPLRITRSRSGNGANALVSRVSSEGSQDELSGETPREPTTPTARRASNNILPDQPAAPTKRRISNGIPAIEENPRIGRTSSTEFVPKVDCTACAETFRTFSVITTPCEHPYCFPCINEYIKANIDGPGFPPKCCNAIIPLDSIMIVLELATVQHYLKRREEVNHPVKIYCAQLHCQLPISATFIINNLGTCACGSVTCILCRFAKHEGPCPPDKDREAFLTLAVENGWRPCPGCNEVIERTDGCNHIT
jgi:hypothetical protein